MSAARHAASETAAPQPATGTSIVLTLLVTFIVAVIGYELLKPAPLSKGAVESATCAWHGRSITVTGRLFNLGPPTADFYLRPRFRLVGIGHFGRRWSTALRVPAGQFRPFAFSREVRKGVVGTPFMSCLPRAVIVPPPTGED